METVLIFVLATALAAGVVWWASSPTEAAKPRTRRQRRPPPVSFQETFQTTAPEPVVSEGRERFVIMSDGPAVDDRPPPLLSVLRIALTITFVAVVAVAVLSAVALFVKLQLDRYFVNSGP